MLDTVFIKLIPAKYLAHVALWYYKYYYTIMSFIYTGYSILSLSKTLENNKQFNNVIQIVPGNNVFSISNGIPII